MYIQRRCAVRLGSPLLAVSERKHTNRKKLQLLPLKFENESITDFFVRIRYDPWRFGVKVYDL